MVRTRPTATLQLNDAQPATYTTVMEALEQAAAQGFAVDYHEAIASLREEGDTYQVSGPSGAATIRRGAKPTA